MFSFTKISISGPKRKTEMSLLKRLSHLNTNIIRWIFCVRWEKHNRQLALSGAINFKQILIYVDIELFKTDWID